MATLVRFCGLLRLLLRSYPWASDSEWAPTHSASLRNFLEGDLGKSLAKHLRNCSLEINARAVQSGDLHQCGVAAGFLLACTYLDRLSVSGGEPQSPTQDENSVEGPEEYLERMAP
jgi:hypothetical protein